MTAGLAMICLGAERTPRFYSLNSKDGLSDNTVFHIYQDRKGFLWFCTQNGLNRYDGYRFEHFLSDPRRPNSLSSSNISMVRGDLRGGLWLATWGGGLNYFDPRSGSFTHFQHDPNRPGTLPDDFVQCLHNTRGNDLWIGTRRAGLVRFDKNLKQFFPIPVFAEDADQQRIWHIVPNRRGQLWLATDRGVRILDAAHYTVLPPPRLPCAPFDLGNSQVRTLFLDQSHHWWIGTSQGLLRYNPATKACDYYPLKPGGERPEVADQINTVLEDRGANIWVGTQLGGLYRFHEEENRFTNYRQNPRLLFTISGNDVRHLFEDLSGNLWVATRRGGVAKLNLKPSKFRKLIHREGQADSLKPGLVNAIDSDDGGHIWFGMETGGLTRYNRDSQSFEHLVRDENNPTTLSHNEVLSLAHDHNGFLWVGTKSGLNRMGEFGVFETFAVRPDQSSAGPVHEEINVLTAHREQMWIGTPRGLSVYEKGVFRHAEGPLQQADINQIAFDDVGRAWLATGTQGVIQMDPDRFAATRFFQSNPNEVNTLPSNEVLCLLPKASHLWLGIYGGGLSKLNLADGAVQRFETRSGLAGYTVWGILEDYKGNLWLSTSRGLSHFRLNDETFLNYDTFDGLQSEVFSRGAYHQTAWGEMVFGGVDGANLFFPDRIEAYQFEPPMMITAVDAMGSPINPHHQPNGRLEMVMDRYDNVMTIYFSAFDYTQPERNRYRYRLTRQETEAVIDQTENWQTGDPRASATFQDVSPGRYRFELFGAGHEGTWVNEALRFDFEVRPPFHQSWWLKSVLILLGIAVPASAIHYFRLRERQRAKVELLTQSERLAVDANQTKSAFLAHMSHELRTPLNHIIGYSELIEEDIAELTPEELDLNQMGADLAKIRAAALYQLTLVNNILELTRIESGRSELYCEWFQVEKIIENTTSQMQALLEKTGNQLIVDTGSQPLGAIHGDQAKVQSMLLNLLTNANKFTDQGTIWFRVRQKNHHMAFEVEDTGIGMSEEQTQKLFRAFAQMVDHNQYGGTGLGLHICNHFCRLMNGTIEVESKKGRGSTFTITIPLVCGVPDSPKPEPEAAYAL
ncbi:ligand-binding sensor domain-containing protein [Acanthopleuribacter pedis]|uniref:histidine kinase n=1 Tax=Acanthopleuribacter pedis TaxID=442870 RepID=A0A8J7Q7U4_9BACT|nr:sensor histidine kinase [Acanthopleuribacter pedis]MBO1318969.1 hypothetical protein [Acanthopleuribacter pedis]